MEPIRNRFAEYVTLRSSTHPFAYGQKTAARPPLLCRLLNRFRPFLKLSESSSFRSPLELGILTPSNAIAASPSMNDVSAPLPAKLLLPAGDGI
jgi:hypothetical protein